MRFRIGWALKGLLTMAIVFVIAVGGVAFITFEIFFGVMDMGFLMRIGIFVCVLGFVGGGILGALGEEEENV